MMTGRSDEETRAATEDEAGVSDDSKQPEKRVPKPPIPGQSRADAARGIAESRGGGIDGAVGGGQSGQGGG